MLIFIKMLKAGYTEALFGLVRNSMTSVHKIVNDSKKTFKKGASPKQLNHSNFGWHAL